MNGDSIPEPMGREERSGRKTTEFCRRAYGSHRCMLVKDHIGAHEAIGKRGPLSWIEDDDSPA
jgi:hypothetical protein